VYKFLKIIIILGWFTNEDLVDQLRECKELFEELHPGCVLLFAFDNSMTHRAKAPDDLDVVNLNKSDGGASVENLRPGWYYVTDAIGNQVKVLQQMQNVAGVHKGLQTILTER
jgi:hypothetical protein